MELQASVDESDIARVTAGLAVAFTVDAHGPRQFAGRVSQVRLQPHRRAERRELHDDDRRRQRGPCPQAGDDGDRSHRNRARRRHAARAGRGGAVPAHGRRAAGRWAGRAGPDERYELAASPQPLAAAGTAIWTLADGTPRTRARRGRRVRRRAGGREGRPALSRGRDGCHRASQPPRWPSAAPASGSPLVPTPHGARVGPDDMQIDDLRYSTQSRKSGPMTTTPRRICARARYSRRRSRRCAGTRCDRA